MSGPLTEDVDPGSPEYWARQRGKDVVYPSYGGSGGISKRELFAAMAMQGFLAGMGNLKEISVKGGGPVTETAIAQQCVEFADALLKELAK
jgi:hypothetical protein